MTRSLSNYIDIDARVHASVVMGERNYFGPGTIIKAGVVIGDDNRFEGPCSVGARPEHKAYWLKDDLPGVVIGNRNTIREFVTINAGTKTQTKMTDDCIMLRGSHLSHDSTLESGVVVSCNVIIGGGSYVFRQANLGISCSLHQHSVVARGVCIGMGATIPKKKFLNPFTIYIGVAQELGKNIKLIKELGITSEQQAAELEIYKRKFREINK